MQKKILKTLQTKRTDAESKVIKEFKSTVAEFKDVLSGGVEITNIDELLVEVSKIDNLTEQVEEFKKALSTLVFPEYEKEVHIKGLDDFIDKLPTEIKVEWLNEDKLEVLVHKLGEIKTAVGEALVAPVDQAPDKFTPVRRVRKVGNVLIYDDSDHGGASGGGTGTQTLNNSTLAKEAKQDDVITALENRYGGGKTPVVFTVTGVGDTTIHTPASGKAIRLFSVDALTDPDEAATPLIKVIIGTTEKIRGYAIGKWEIFEGAADEVLKINLSAGSSVSGTAIITEFTP